MPTTPGITTPYGAGGALVLGGVVVVVSAGLQPTNAKQAASVSNAISFIFELLMFPYCERPGLLGRLALSRRTFTHWSEVAKPFFYLPTCVNPNSQARVRTRKPKIKLTEKCQGTKNDEFRMSNDERNPNDEVPGSSLELRHSFDIRH